jgi:hypothetical protein
MAKSQKHSNREVKKPKQIKVVQPAANEGLLALADGAASPANKKRP